MKGEFEFYAGLSGLGAGRSLADHKLAYFRAQSGLGAGLSSVDYERTWLAGLYPTVGPDIDALRLQRAKALSGLPAGLSYADYATAMFAGGGGDVTAPTAGTLASSNITSTTFDLTVSGASDAVGLHAQPYRFSTDNGSTWSAWQTSPVFNVTGKTASTAYTCVHQTRDAALNQSTGSSIVVNTLAASGLNGTFIEQRGSTTNMSAGVPYSFGASPIGAAAPDRKVWVAVSGRDVAAAPSSVTIGGITAAMEVNRNASGTVSIWSATVPTGTDADIIVTFAGSQSFCSIGVWTTLGGSVVETVQATAAAGGVITAATASAQAGDFIIEAITYRASVTGPQVAFNAVTERYDLDVDGLVREAAGGDLVATGAVNDLGATISNYGAEGVMVAVVIRTWTPASLGAALRVWLDADDAATFSFSSGSVVSQWNDKSGGGRHVSQGTVSAQPSRSGTLGSRTAVVFDGSDDFLGFTGTTITAQPLTVAFAALATTNPGNASLIDTSTSGGRVLIEPRSGALWRMFAGAVRDVAGSNVIGTPHVVVATFNGASSELRVDGVSLGTGDAGSNSLLSAASSTLYIGRGQGGFLGCTIGEVVVIAGVLSAPDLASLEAYLVAKWGTP